MDINAIASPAAQPKSTSPGSQALAPEDFLKLLITQLSNQDPLEPTSNEQLLNQLSSIQEIQLSTSLVDSMNALVGNQRFGAVSSMIGKQISAQFGDEQSGDREISGVVVAIRFDAEGKADLELDSGELVALDQVTSIETPENAATELIGRLVRGTEQNSSGETRTIEGIVTSVRTDLARGQILELDTGEELQMTEASLAA